MQSLTRLILAASMSCAVAGRADAQPAFIATAAVTWNFTAASNSASRTIPTADAVFLSCIMFPATGNTVASTIAGAAPTSSFQATGSDIAYLAIFVAAPSGAQTVAITGGDAGDNFLCGFRGVNGLNTTTPFSNSVTDTATPLSIDVTSTSTGLVVGCIEADDAGITSSNTEIWELVVASTASMNCATAPGTGGTVTLTWTGNSGYASGAVNINAAAGGTTAPRLLLLGVGDK